MRILFLLFILFISLTPLLSQSVRIQHLVEPNASYRVTLTMTLDKEIEEIRDINGNGVSHYKADFTTSSDSSFLQLNLSTSDAERYKVPFIVKVEAMTYPNSDNAKISDIRIHGNYSSSQRMIIDSIKGTANQSQYDQLFHQLDLVYRSLKWPNKELVMNDPILKSAETPMLKSSSKYTWNETRDKRSGRAKGIEYDNTEINGTFWYNKILKLIERHSYRKVFSEQISYVNKAYVSDSKRVTTYDWKFEKLD